MRDNVYWVGGQAFLKDRADIVPFFTVDANDALALAPSDLPSLALLVPVTSRMEVSHLPAKVGNTSLLMYPGAVRVEYHLDGIGDDLALDLRAMLCTPDASLDCVVVDHEVASGSIAMLEEAVERSAADIILISPPNALHSTDLLLKAAAMWMRTHRNVPKFR